MKKVKVIKTTMSRETDALAWHNTTGRVFGVIHILKNW